MSRNRTLGRRAFLAGTSLLVGCRACVGGKPTKPITPPPYKLLYTAKGSLVDFAAGDGVHHFLETLLVDGGYRTRVIELTAATGATKVLTEAADSYPTLAVSPGFAWFRASGKLARVPRAGGPVETFFVLPHDYYPIAADASGAYAFRPTDPTLALSTDVELVQVTEKGDVRLLGSKFFPDAMGRLATTADDVIFWNTTGTTGSLAVPKAGGAARLTERRAADVVQGADVYRADDNGVWAVDATSGANKTKLMGVARDGLLGVLPGGIVFAHSESSIASFGSNMQSFSYALRFYDFSVENDGPIFDLRPGQFVRGGPAGAGLVAWASDGEVGQVG